MRSKKEIQRNLKVSRDIFKVCKGWEWFEGYQTGIIDALEDVLEIKGTLWKLKETLSHE
jgi:hypothetical protein